MSRVKRDDVVQVISGRDKGRTGRIVKLMPKENKCIVEGVGVVKRHQKATAAGAPSGIIEKNMKVDLSNVMPLDPKTKKPTRVAFKTQDGKKMRLAAASGAVLETTLKA